MLAHTRDAGLCPVQTVPNSWEYGALCMRLITCCQFRVVIHMPFKCPWLPSTWLQHFLMALGLLQQQPQLWGRDGRMAPAAAHLLHCCSCPEHGMAGTRAQLRGCSLALLCSYRQPLLTGWWQGTQLGRARECCKTSGEFWVETWFYFYVLLIQQDVMPL